MSRKGTADMPTNQHDVISGNSSDFALTPRQPSVVRLLKGFIFINAQVRLQVVIPVIVGDMNYRLVF